MTKMANQGIALLLATILGAALIAGSLIFVVASRTAELRAGYALHALQQKKARLLQRRGQLQLEVAALKRPERLARLALDLGLAPVTSAQVLGSQDKPEGDTP